MDNHFVPNLTIGLPVVERLAEVSDLPLDVHLMIADADRWAPDYADAGAGSVTFHVEAATAPVRLARTPARARRPRGHGAAPGHRGRAVRRPAGRAGHAAADDGGARLRRPGVPRPGAAEDPGRPRAGQGPRPATCGSRSTAGWPPRRSSAAPRRAPTCSWPARRSTAPTTRRPRCRGSGSRPRQPPPPPGGAGPSPAEPGRARRWRRVAHWGDEVRTHSVLRGRCNSEPAVTVRDPSGSHQRWW